MIGLKFRDLIPQSLLDELDQLVAGIRGHIFTEHHPEGTHSDVHADTVESTWFRALELVKDAALETGRFTWRALGGPSGYTDSSIRHDDEMEGTATGKVLRLTAEAQEVHFDLPTGHAMRLGVTSALGAAVEQRFDDALTANHQLRLAGQSEYEPAPGDTAALGDVADGPKYSVYRLTPTADTQIEGIYADLAEGNRGQVLILINDSAFTVTFSNAVVTNKRKILGGVMPMDLGPQHVAMLVYDNVGEGWRIINVFTGTPGGDDEPLVFCARITLDDAQIAALPTTKIEIPKVDLTGTAPGAGFSLNPFRMGFTLDTSGAAFGNIASPSLLRVLVGDVVVAGADISSALGIPDTTTGMFDPAGTPGSVNIDNGVQSSSANLENMPFYVDLSNALGALTGGTGATLLLDVWYVIDPVTVTPFVGSIVYTTSVRKVAPPAANGVSITPSGTNQANSAWAVLSASSGADWALAAVAFNPGVSGVFVEFDIGVGAGGSEVVIATISGQVNSEATCANHRLPWTIPIGGRIPLGSRVTVRMRKTGTDTTAWTAAIEYFEEPMTGNAVVSPVVGLPRGGNNALTPSATDNAYSSWVLQVSSSPLLADLVVGGVSVTFPAANEPYEISYGKGTAGQESTVYKQRGIAKDISLLGHGGPYYTTCYPALPRIRAGQALTTRMRKNGTDVTPWFAAFQAYSGAAFPLLTTDKVNKWYPDTGDTLISMNVHATPWSSGNYTAMFTTTVETAILAILLNIDTTVRDIEVDIAIGSPGNEVVQATVRQSFQSLFSGDIQAIPMVLARNIQAGEIVSLRVRADATGGIAAGIGYMESPDFFQRVDECSHVYPPAAGAVSVAGHTTAWNNSNYGELKASVAADEYLTHLNFLTTLTGIEVEFELAVGAAASEVGIGSFRTFVGNTSSGGNGQIAIIPPVLITSGSRLAVRFRKTGTSATGFTFSAVATPV